MTNESQCSKQSCGGRRLTLLLSLFTLALVLGLIGFLLLAAFKLDRWKKVRTLLQEGLMVETRQTGEENRRIIEQLLEQGNAAKEILRTSWPATRFGATAHFSGKFSIPAENLYTFLIEEISPLPEAENSTYPDCLRTARAKLVHSPDIPGLAKFPIEMETVLVFWAFQDRKHSLGANLKEGDWILGWPYENIAGDFVALQTSDTVDHDEARVIFLAQQTPVSATESVDSQPVSPIPNPEDLCKATIERLEWELKTYGNNDWNEWIKRTQPLRDELIRLNMPETTNVTQVIDSPYTHDVTDIFKKEYNYHWDGFTPTLNYDDTVKLTGMNGQKVTFVQHVKEVSDALAKRGITLIFAPIPFKSLVCQSIFLTPEQLEGQEETSPAWRKMIYDLAQAGVEVVDLTPVYRQHWQEHPDQPLYLEDHHLTPLALKLSAEAVSKHAARFVPEEDRIKPGNLTMQPSVMEYNLKPYVDISRKVDGDIIRMRNEEGIMVPFAPNRKSPIIVFGDSNMFVGRGITDNGKIFYGVSVSGFRGDMTTHLSYALNHVIDEGDEGLTLTRPGIEHVPAKRLEGKKAVVVLNMTPHIAMAPLAADAWISQDGMQK